MQGLTVVVVPFDSIARIEAGSQAGRPALVIWVIVKETARQSDAPRYSPRRLHFIVATWPNWADHLKTWVERANITVFGTYGISSEIDLTAAPKPPRFVVFVNPKAGKGRGVKIFKKDIQPILEAAGCRFPAKQDAHAVDSKSMLIITQAQNQALNDVQALKLREWDGILCVGGDGSVHEVINGLAKRPDGRRALQRLAIGVIPTGMSILINLTLGSGTISMDNLI